MAETTTRDNVTELPKRRRVVVDTETTGLDPAEHIAIEVAWWCIETGERGRFVPPHGEYDIARATTEALEINGYWDRGLDNPNRWDSDGTEARRLHGVLDGQTMVGSNPRFDAAMLGPLFADLELSREPWHYRLLDLAAYAMGVLGLDHPVSLGSVCRRLNVSEGDHTAEGDVTAAGLCLQALERHRWVAPAANGLVVLDPQSQDDIERLTRVVLRLNKGTKLSSRERNHGRALLRQLRGEAS